MRDTGNVGLAFSYGDPSIDSGIGTMHNLRLPSSRFLDRLLAWDSEVQHFTWLNAHTSHLRRYLQSIRCFHLSLPLLFKDQIDCSPSFLYFSSPFDFYLPTELSAEEVLIKNRKHRWEQSGILRLSKLRNKRQLILQCAKLAIALRNICL